MSPTSNFFQSVLSHLAVPLDLRFQSMTPNDEREGMLCWYAESDVFGPQAPISVADGNPGGYVWESMLAMSSSCLPPAPVGLPRLSILSLGSIVLMLTLSPSTPLLSTIRIPSPASCSRSFWTPFETFPGALMRRRRWYHGRGSRGRFTFCHWPRRVTAEVLTSSSSFARR